MKLARNSVVAEKRGRAKIPSPQSPSFLPARAKIIKNQRPDFRGKKFGFYSGDTANDKAIAFMASALVY